LATNDSHYVNQDEWNAHAILLCHNTGDVKSTPIGDAKGMRFGFPNDQFYFKSTKEMMALFSDIPEAIDNTQEIVDKVQTPDLKRSTMLPNFPLPPGFDSADHYLESLTWDGARKRYKEITAEVEERLTHELSVIKKMGFAGYFLIVSDFIRAGRDMGVLVGPGRGSAAGSAVAFCIGITNIDPIKYSLLFERFLNPERVSMPDIDTDFDDNGRQRVIDYVVEKYGRNRVAQIITYGSMAAKTSIKDVARALELPLAEANALSKLVPEKPGITLQKAYDEVKELKDLRDAGGLKGEVLRTAEILEGSVRNTGVHAAGVIIAPEDITDLIPVTVAKDAELLVTQFEGKVIEEAGMLKMDFLGLKTLTTIREAIKLIELNKGVVIDSDNIPLDDEVTLKLYQRGDTVGIFQFESDGMRKCLRDLKPNHIEDLVAMNALYRPGPLDFIPVYIDRKMGRQPVEYPHELLEPILKTTYGIMVYQEQIMQAAQIVAGYSLGGADLLRRAMGKKDKETMAKERIKFVKGAGEIHGISQEKSNEIFDVMERFAEYGFNRSHSAAYSVVSFQTAYLKANHPAEFMAALLNTYNDMDNIIRYMEEARRMGIAVLGPDINESESGFTVNAKGEVRFGLAALKGVGEGAVAQIISERTKSGPFKNIFDLSSRISLRLANRRCFESLAGSGAFDSFGNIHRAQYFHREGNEIFLDRVIRYGGTAQEQQGSAQVSLFGDTLETTLPEPELPASEPWSELEKLRREKEIIGIYITGHPLDSFAFEVKHFCKNTVADIKPENLKDGRELAFAAIVSSATHRFTKEGKPMGSMILEDKSYSQELSFFGDEYLKIKNYMTEGVFLFLKGKVEPRFRNSEQLVFRPSLVMLLNEVRDKFSKELILSMNLSDLHSESVKQLQRTFAGSPGELGFSFRVMDPASKMSVEMQSRKHRIKLSDDLIKFIEARDFFEYELKVL
ncbi:MAG: polymerase subunit alpha, partial [Bacteroidota bacterium]